MHFLTMKMNFCFWGERLFYLSTTPWRHESCFYTNVNNGGIGCYTGIHSKASVKSVVKRWTATWRPIHPNWPPWKTNPSSKKGGVKVWSEFGFGHISGRLAQNLQKNVSDLSQKGSTLGWFWFPQDLKTMGFGGGPKCLEAWGLIFLTGNIFPKNFPKFSERKIFAKKIPNLSAILSVDPRHDKRMSTVHAKFMNDVINLPAWRRHNQSKWWPCGYWRNRVGVQKLGQILAQKVRLNLGLNPDPNHTPSIT